MSKPLCGCPQRQPEADPMLYLCPCGAHCTTCKPREQSPSTDKHNAPVMSEEGYYAAHECPACDPIEHCPHAVSK